MSLNSLWFQNGQLSKLEERKRTFFRTSKFDGWPFLNQLELRVPHFKGLISANLNPRAQRRDGTFAFCHVHLKKSILVWKCAFLNLMGCNSRAT